MSKERTIQSLIDEIKSRERGELRTALITYGKKVDNGFEYTFGPDYPVIAAYCGEEPADVVVLSAKMDKNGCLTIIGEEKLDRTFSFELDVDNIFAGQLGFVISEIG